MEIDNKLVPYSVNLTRGIYEALKKLAQKRQASAMVRDALTMIIEGHGEYASGYNKGLRDSSEVINNDRIANAVSFDGQKIADILNDQISCLVK